MFWYADSEVGNTPDGYAAKFMNQENIAMVNALAKFDNFCTDESDIPVEALARDMNNIVNNRYGYV